MNINAQKEGWGRSNQGLWMHLFFSFKKPKFLKKGEIMTAEETKKLGRDLTDEEIV